MRTSTARSPTARTFNEEFQDLITRYAWGEIWTRPGLPRHTRSLITLALMIALHHDDEFRMHVRAAFNNGVTKDEIKEVILQCAIYAGVPAANSAFRMAEEVFAHNSVASHDRANVRVLPAQPLAFARRAFAACHAFATPGWRCARRRLRQNAIR